MNPVKEVGGKNKWIKDIWNTYADPSLSRCKFWTKNMNDHAKKVLEDYPDKEMWIEAIEAINKSPFCLGHNNRGWRASLSWLLGMSQTYKKVWDKLFSGYYEFGQEPSPVKSVNKKWDQIHNGDHNKQVRKEEQQL